MSRRKKNRTIKRSYIIIESSNEIFNICTPSSRTTNAAHFLPPSTERLIYSFLSISLTISSRIRIVSKLLMFPFYKKTFEPKCVECHSNTVQLPLQYRTMHANKKFARLICQFRKFNPLECRSQVKLFGGFWHICKCSFGTSWKNSELNQFLSNWPNIRHSIFKLLINVTLK